jgi:YYY domain-containing protein
MAEWEYAARWLVGLLMIGWLGLPIVRWLAPSLPDEAACLARPFGVLLVGYAAWLAASLRLLPFAAAVWAVGLPLLGLLAIVAALRQRRARPAPPRGTLLAWSAHEAVFVAVFVGFAWLRGYTPDITFTEKPMELMLLNSALHASAMPPADNWLAGATVNYYYLGYVLAAALTHLSGVPVGYAFNLMLTTIVALSAATVYGLAGNLWALHRDAVAPRLTPVAGAVGLLAAYCLVAAGNLVGGWAWLRDPAGTVAATWWGGIGWASSRVIHDQVGGGADRQTINEFPWFSFILGDLHPHVLALPFGLLALGLALDWWRWSPAVGALKGDRLALGRLLLGALCVGALYAINSWDFPLALLLTGLALTRPAWAGPAEERAAWRPIALLTIGLALASVLLLLPFFLSFVSFAGNSGIRLAPPADRVPLLDRLVRSVGIVTWPRTSLGEFLQIYGFLLTAAAAWLVLLLRRGPRLAPNVVGLALIGVCLLGLLLGSAPVALAGALVVLAVLTWSRGHLSGAETFIGTLAIVGLGLPIVAEFVFLQDAFADRMNTVFKAYYQSWTLLSLVAALGVGASLGAVGRALRAGAAPLERALTLAGGAVVAATLALTLGYPLIATPARAERFAERPGLDGLAYLNDQPDEAAALRWLAANVAPGTIVAEDPGRSYGEYFGVPDARAATIVGTRAPLAWPGHQQQWRANQPTWLAEINTRLRDLQQLYSTTDTAVAQRLMSQYGIEYVYVGRWERDADARQRARQIVYPPAALAKFDTFMDPVFRQGQVAIYKRRP